MKPVIEFIGNLQKKMVLVVEIRDGRAPACQVARALRAGTTMQERGIVMLRLGWLSILQVELNFLLECIDMPRPF